MNAARLGEIIALERKEGYVYIATADGEGMSQTEKQLVTTVGRAP